MQDIVPNHMAYDSQNAMLMDVLEKGPNSPYRDYFDIDWNHMYENLNGRLLAPFLGSFYGEALENGELNLVYDEKGLGLSYYALRLPLRIESYFKVFGGEMGPLEAALGADTPELAKFIGTVGLFKNLAADQLGGYPAEQADHAKKMLMDIYAEAPDIKVFMDGAISRFNGRKGDSPSFDALDDLLSSQFFRPSYWKVAAAEINYRRFFTINDLISLKVEEPMVFDYVHKTVLRLANEGRITALRVDHVDGLIDPQRYLEHLRQAAGPDVYISVEKILAPGEELPSDWAIQGTTGYDFMNYVNGLFCRRENGKEFSRLYYRFTGLKMPYEDLVCAKKRMIISDHLAGNIDNLAHTIKKSAVNDRHGRDITLYGLRRALVEIMANFPVYRTYINGADGPREPEKIYIKAALKGARKRLLGFDYELNFIEAFLLMGEYKSLERESADMILRFAMSFQQYTSPLMAKGFEDTILYIYNKLTSLNEVGSAPNLFGFDAEQVHDFNSRRAASWPLSMNASSTHDTKRSEDIRARINVLSEIPDEFNSKLKVWSGLNLAKKRKNTSRARMPDRNDEYFIYQTLLGAWPTDGVPDAEFAGRIKDYAIKSAREAQVKTNWIKPNSAYEDAYSGFIDRLLHDETGNKFMEDFLPFQRRVAFFGVFNSLSQTLLKIAAPGIPDFYQGSELWDLSLVDPDNRSPVDFALRGRFIDEIRKGFSEDSEKLIAELMSDLPSGRINLFLIWRALAERSAKAEIFEKGFYLPLKTEGECSESLFAFARIFEGQSVIVAAPRFLTVFAQEGQSPLGALWKDTRLILPSELDGDRIDAFSGRKLEAKGGISAAELFHNFPCALLSRA
jgi:(1->4)-alpha-D-glucan 1-alpha-D-glucosylmutase